MGAADVVPGVSGGTIAFITGIYEELLSTISSLRPVLIKTLFKQGFRAFWQAGNFSFLAALLSGIFLAILTLAHVLSWLLEHEPVLLWSFFFGLVLASVFFVGRQVKKWSLRAIMAFPLGAVVAWYITSLPPSGIGSSTMILFLSGMIAICAMILPGISGSFILLILGVYHSVIEAVKNFDFVKVAAFGLGCVIGLLSFSHILNWMYKKHHDITVALLTGFLLGSLQKLWPWQKKLELLHTHNDGRQDWLMHNVFPNGFEGDPKIMGVLICFIVGFALIFVIERIGKRA